MDIQFTDLSPLYLNALITLHSDAQVIRYMPLAEGLFDQKACHSWIQSKRQLWDDHGYGPWAILLNGQFAGWGGFQPEQGEPDLALVLLPEFWGYGKSIYLRMIQIGFSELGFDSITVLLPPERKGLKGIVRLGFQPDGEVLISGNTFLRFRLYSKDIASE